MFDQVMVKELDEAVTAACAADYSLATSEQLATVLRVVQASMDALAGVHARAAGAFEAMGGHEQDGCARVGVWLRRELRLTKSEIRSRRLGDQALTQLDQVRAAAHAGAVRPEHVTVFGEGIGYLGAQVMTDAQDLLLPVAESCDPHELRAAIQQLREAVTPDDADAEWAKAQEMQDLTCIAAGYGWLVRGFLDTDTGARLHAVLRSWGQPVTVEGQDVDDRPVARRRVEGLNTLLSDYLGSGLPTDKGIRPQLNVTVDHETLILALRGDRTTRTATPATLAGFGVIGRDLLARLACDASLTVLLTDATTNQHRSTTGHHVTSDVAGGGEEGQRGVLHRCGCPITPYVHVLDVGDAERLATPKQRLAVLTAQGHRCATPGCNNQHLEIHHLEAWLDSRRTDMNNLIGLCAGCHTLLHRGLILARSDGHGGAVFTRKDGRPIDDVRRRSVAAYAEQLRDHVSAIILQQHRSRHRSRLRPRGHPPSGDHDGSDEGPDRATEARR